MDKDNIDASVGLAFSLELFRVRRLSGLLQAELRRAPSIPRNSVATLQLIDGMVVYCYVADKNGQSFAISKDELIKLDTEKGPFEWIFHRFPPASPPTQAPIPTAPSRPSQPAGTNPSLLAATAVPRVIAPLERRRLPTWTHQQLQLLDLVWQAIDGKKTIWEIKRSLGQTIPAHTVHDLLRVLLDLRVITLI